MRYLIDSDWSISFLRGARDNRRHFERMQDIDIISADP